MAQKIDPLLTDIVFGGAYLKISIDGSFGTTQLKITKD
jgi:hypothetical protein